MSRGSPERARNERDESGESRLGVADDMRTASHDMARDCDPPASGLLLPKANPKASCHHLTGVVTVRAPFLFSIDRPPLRVLLFLRLLLPHAVIVILPKVVAETLSRWRPAKPFSASAS